MTQLSKEQIQECEWFILSILKKIIQINEWNLNKVNSFDEKRQIIELYINSIQLDLWILKSQFVTLWIHWYLNATQLDWKLKRVLFYFVLKNKKDPFVFMHYFEYFSETHKERFDQYFLNTLLYWLLEHSNQQFQYHYDANWNLDTITYKNNTYFKRKLWIFEEINDEMSLISYYDILWKIISESYQYSDEKIKDEENDLKIWYERIYCKHFNCINVDNVSLSNIVNFANKYDPLFSWLTLLHSVRYEKNNDNYIQMKEEDDYDNKWEEEYVWMKEEKKVKRQYWYQIYFDYDVSKNYDKQLEEFYQENYEWIIKFYWLLQKSVEFEEWILVIRKNEWKIQTLILSLLQFFWLFARTSWIFDTEYKEKEKIRKLLDIFLYANILLQLIQWSWNEQLCLTKEIWNDYKLWFVLWHTDISKKNTLKTIQNKDDFLELTQKYIISSLVWYKWEKEVERKNIVWFSRKWIWLWNFTIFKFFLNNIPKIQEITLNWIEYSIYWNTSKEIEQKNELRKQLYLSDWYQLKYTITENWSIQQIVVFEYQEEKKSFLWLKKEKISSLKNIYELWKKEWQKCYTTQEVKTPYQFITLYSNLFYLPYYYHFFNSWSLNDSIIQKSKHLIIKYILSKYYWIPIKYLVISCENNTINFEIQCLESDKIFEQLKKDWIMTMNNHLWTSLSWSITI